MFAELRSLAPSIAITVRRELDPDDIWDGDAPDPREDGYDAYDIIVTARAIVNGELIEGENTLGRSYYLQDEPIGDAHGYLTQMIDEALNELKSNKHLPVEIREQIIKAQMFVTDEMKRRYEEQMKERSS